MGADRKTKIKKRKKAKKLKPISLHPLKLEDALRGAMQVPPPKHKSKDDEEAKD